MHANFTFNTSRLTLTDLGGNVSTLVTQVDAGIKEKQNALAYYYRNAKEMAELGFNLVDVRVSGLNEWASYISKVNA